MKSSFNLNYKIRDINEEFIGADVTRRADARIKEYKEPRRTAGSFLFRRNEFGRQSSPPAARRITSGRCNCMFACAGVYCTPLKINEKRGNAGPNRFVQSIADGTAILSSVAVNRCTDRDIQPRKLPD